MTTPVIRAALERLLQVVKPKYNEPDEIIAVVQAIASARDALAAADAGGGEALLAAPAAEGDGQRSAVLEAVGKALGNAYDCLRVWEAWSVGTMGPDDFALVAEDDTRLAEIADAAIQAMRPVVEKETKQLRLLFDKTRHQMADSLGVDRGCGWTSLAMEARNLRSAATPAADWVEPSDEQLIDAWNENSEYYALHAEACDFARDVLTRWGRLAATAAPAAPPKGEVAELVAWLNVEADLRRNDLSTPTGLNLAQAARQADRLQSWATLLQQQAAELAALRAGVVAVSDRPWEREAGWLDLDGECWWCPPDGPPYWSMANPTMVYGGLVLPAYAIPLPAPQGGEWQGADHPDGPWRPIPAPQPGLPWSVDPPAAGQRQALSPTVQAIMAAIQGETSPQIIVAQAYRALAFLRLAEPSACELLVDVAQELDP